MAKKNVTVDSRYYDLLGAAYKIALTIKMGMLPKSDDIDAFAALDDSWLASMNRKEVANA